MIQFGSYTQLEIIIYIIYMAFFSTRLEHMRICYIYLFLRNTMRNTAYR